jgi:hypothetical protein
MEDERVRVCSMSRRDENCRQNFRTFVGKPEGKRPLTRPRCNKRIILKCLLKKGGIQISPGLIWLKTGSSGGLRVPYNAGNFLTR